MTKLALPDVTLVMVTTVAHELSRMALEECTARCDFGSLLIISDRSSAVMPPLGMVRTLPPPFKIGVQAHTCGPMDLEQVCRAYWYDVPPLVQTSHFLIIQHDSWVTNPEAWTDDFLRYDYIGAPWWYVRDDRNVGNGGFSLRSTRLAKYVSDNPGKFPFAMPEDDALCRQYRFKLDNYGFKFAPNELAMQFSYERVRPFDTDGHPMKPFGFHGAFNWPDVLTDKEIVERLKNTSYRDLTHVHYQQMFQELKARGRGDRIQFAVSGARIHTA